MSEQNKAQIQKGINWLQFLLNEYDHIFKIISLVQDYPDFFDCRVGHSTLEAAARYLEDQVDKEGKR